MRFCAESGFQKGWILVMRVQASSSSAPSCNSSQACQRSQPVASVAISCVQLQKIVAANPADLRL